MEVIPLDGSSFTPSRHVPTPVTNPYRPFRTLEDFRYAKTAVFGNLNKDLVNEQLDLYRSANSPITFRNHVHMMQSVDAATDCFVKVGIVL